MSDKHVRKRYQNETIIALGAILLKDFVSKCRDMLQPEIGEDGNPVQCAILTTAESSIVKFLFDLLPVILFFVTFKFGESHAPAVASQLGQWLGTGIEIDQAPILAATAVAIIASIAQVAWIYMRGKKPEPMLWISLAIIVVFGSLTLLLHNGIFIKWKPSILYWAFAAILGYGAMTGRNFLKTVLGSQLELDESAWGKMQIAWIVFFVVVGIVNLAVAYTCETATWVNFKLFGLTSLTFIFTLAIGLWIAKGTQNGQNSE